MRVEVRKSFAIVGLAALGGELGCVPLAVPNSAPTQVAAEAEPAAPASPPGAYYFEDVGEGRYLVLVNFYVTGDIATVLKSMEATLDEEARRHCGGGYRVEAKDYISPGCVRGRETIDANLMCRRVILSCVEETG
jgi:hypothetical protein